MRLAKSLVQGRGNVRRRRGRGQVRGFPSDDLPVDRLGRQQIGFRGVQLRVSAAERRFGLGDVGVGHLADLEAVAGGAELLGQNFDVLAIEFDDRLRRQHVHVRLSSAEQSVLLGIVQGRAAGLNRGLGRLRVVYRLEAAKQILADRHADGAGGEIRGPENRNVGRGLLHRSGAEYLRSPGRQRLRDQFVRRAQSRSGGIEVGIAHIGGRQRRYQRFRSCRWCRGTQAQKSGERSGEPPRSVTAFPDGFDLSHA
ncbi:hypothetical protein MUB46_19295 [Microbaculum sp. A6E488]|uniref:Uncharacterized protein n=1 Tax=Microbaculum marinisediminis TaxID=2931392 RepID=A0AAW5R670_9HYPH|nr:hypothetical protein [Microbaculum sp. A6E488]MCT8974015.1 hypothetical protein [Microbaculum sp. A6E488]